MAGVSKAACHLRVQDPGQDGEERDKAGLIIANAKATECESVAFTWQLAFRRGVMSYLRFCVILHVSAILFFLLPATFRVVGFSCAPEVD